MHGAKAILQPLCKILFVELGFSKDDETAVQ
jgi:hypothetical protein